MEINFLVLALSALVPLVVGFIWYYPKIFGNAWMTSAGLTEESMKGANMALIFVLSYIFSFMFAMAVQFMVIHQYHVFSIFAGTPEVNDPTSEIGQYYQTFMDNYGRNFRTFKHGALHGFLSGLFVVLPILATNALYERKGFKYIAINVGYWTLCLILMGGIICQWA